MPPLKGHFNGNAIILDEPANLTVGQKVHVLPAPTAGTLFTPFVDLTPTLMNGDTWDESAALHIDPLDQVPPDFIRRPGSAAGQIKIADDFDATPDDFKDYL